MANSRATLRNFFRSSFLLAAAIIGIALCSCQSKVSEKSPESVGETRGVSADGTPILTLDERIKKQSDEQGTINLAYETTYQLQSALALISTVADSDITDRALAGAKAFDDRELNLTTFSPSLKSYDTNEAMGLQTFATSTGRKPFNLYAWFQDLFLRFKGVVPNKDGEYVAKLEVIPFFAPGCQPYDIRMRIGKPDKLRITPLPAYRDKNLVLVEFKSCGSSQAYTPLAALYFDNEKLTFNLAAIFGSPTSILPPHDYRLLINQQCNAGIDSKQKLRDILCDNLDVPIVSEKYLTLRTLKIRNQGDIRLEAAIDLNFESASPQTFTLLLHGDGRIYTALKKK